MMNEVDDARRVTIKCLCRIMKDNERNCCSWLLNMCSPHDGSFLLAMTKNACTHDGDLRTGRNSYGPVLHTWLFRANRGRNQLVNASLLRREEHWLLLSVCSPHHDSFVLAATTKRNYIVIQQLYNASTVWRCVVMWLEPKGWPFPNTF